MAEIWKGAPVAAALTGRLRTDCAELKARGAAPCLAIVRLGERGDDIAYERGAQKRCEGVGITVRHVTLPAATGQNELLTCLRGLNNDKLVHGVLLLRPLPKGMDDDLIRNSLAPEKDVDGITDASLAGVFTGTGVGYPPCTAAACMELLAHYGVELAGKRAVVVGRSLVVGKPLAMMLLAKNATVTMCHTRTADMPAACRSAEVLLVSAGRAGLVGARHLAPGQMVVDVGINVTEDGALAGDVDAAAAESIAAAYTPVPGGVGAVTTAVLAAHVVKAARAVQHRAAVV